MFVFFPTTMMKIFNTHTAWDCDIFNLVVNLKHNGHYFLIKASRYFLYNLTNTSSNTRMIANLKK